MYKIWQIQEVDPQIQLVLSRELGISKVMATVLINRGLTSVSSASKFLNPSLSNLNDPFRLKDMSIVIERIKKAVKHKQKVLIVGDYDVDGISSCAILKSVLERLGLEVSYYLPHRIVEGYGLSKQAAKFCLDIKAKLLFTVDCGITNHKQIEFLRRNGVDTIIIDHHQPRDVRLPAAVAIINPKRHDCAYPYKELATVGLVHKLVEALWDQKFSDFLDLVSIGTIADVVPLNGENRIFVKEGLKCINFPKRSGLRVLLETCGLKTKRICADNISFIIGPRLNAAGRIRHAKDSLRLLLTESEDEAHRLARNLEKDNRARQSIQDRVLKEALAKIDKEINFRDHYVIVLSSQGWHRGILGIVASKIADRFHRPTVIISLEQDIGKGSARSISCFHLFEALSQCSEYLEGFGGHKYAAGLTISAKNIELFSSQINRIAKDLLRPEDLIPSINIDMQVSLSDLDKDLIQELEGLAPFGKGNLQPLFCLRDLYLKGKPAIMGRGTIKFWVSDGEHFFEAVGFGMANCMDLICNASSLDLCFAPKLDSWQGTESIILQLKDIKFNQPVHQ